MVNALGIDVEEWYHLCGVNMPTDLSDAYESRVVENTERMLKILDALQTKATFFVLGVVAERFPHIVKNINDAGHEVASHGYLHLEVFKHTEHSFRADLKKSMEILEEITKKPVVGYRAPGFSITRDSLWVLDILADEGIQYDCSIFPIRHPRYGIPSAPRIPYRVRPELVEFPPSTFRLLGENFPIAGGAYLRLLPYKWIKAAIENLNNRYIAVNSYIHVWEIDTQQPKLKLPLKRYVSHYAGTKTAQEKFENLLADFQFAPVAQVIQNGRF